jgi:6-phosphogluconolactonase
MSLSCRLCLPSLVCLALALTARPAAPERGPAGKGGPEKLWLFIGTYTPKGGPSKGIYRLELDLATGKLSKPEVAAELVDPSFLAIAPDRKHLYAVNETGNFRGERSGSISAFAIDPKTGALKALNSQTSKGAAPCHIVVGRAGKHVLAANYTGGSACAVAIQPDGSLGEVTAFAPHKGSSVNKQRQEAPHAHSINLDPAGRFAFVADLGLDKVMIYRYDADKGTLTPSDPPAASVAPGAGPRHFAFHPDGRKAYVINELNSTITSFDYDPKRGALTGRQTVSTLPKGGFKGNSTADIHVHPSGKFLYGSNRGHDSIAVFAIDPKTGGLTPAGHQREYIKTPRNFGIDPSGTYLIVANQDANTLAVFRIDPATGALAPTRNVVAVPRPVCIQMMPKPR